MLESIRLIENDNIDSTKFQMSSLQGHKNADGSNNSESQWNVMSIPSTPYARIRKMKLVHNLRVDKPTVFRKIKKHERQFSRGISARAISDHVSIQTLYQDNRHLILRHLSN